LSHKISALGILGVAGVSLVGGMHIYSEMTMAAYREVAENAGDIFELSGKIQNELLDTRRAEKDFLIRSERKKAEVQAELNKAVMLDIDALLKQVEAIGKADLVRKIEVTRSSLKQYQEKFISVVDDKTRFGLDEKSGLGGKMRESAKKFVASVDKLHQSDLSVVAVMMRQHEKDFLLTRDDTYNDDMLDRAKEFGAQMEKADIPGPAKTELKQELADYQRDFLALHDCVLDLDDDIRSMAGAFSKVEPAIAAVSETVSAIRSEANQELARLRDKIDWQMKAAIASVGIVVLGIGLLIGRSVSKPLSSMRGAMIELAGGNFSIVLPGLGRADEIGEIAQAVETFKINAEQKARDEVESGATRDQEAARQRKADMIRLADDFESAVGAIIETVSSASIKLETSAGALSLTAESTQDLATMVAKASDEAYTNVGSVAAATEELSSSVNEIGRQVQESAQMAKAAVDQASRTNGRVSELSKAADRIGAVVELINSIAAQTNLLALNATIEAARAGDAGRGFAVVASEVKALAQQTAKATDEIGQQIAGIQTATQDSVALIQEVSNTIEKMSEISSTIAMAVEGQGAATQEISHSVLQAVQGTQQVSSSITDVQRGASETGSASSHVLSAAQSLSSDSTRLKFEVGKFLSSVRA
jgi:methyl-accepting chemotaxis protein